MRWLLICLSALTISADLVAAEEPPTVFAPGVISGPAHDAAPAFSPDGKTVYFGRSNAAMGTILVSSLGENGHWKEPKIAPFSGRWNDLEPAMAPDGSYLVFVSNRPAVSSGPPAEAFYNGKSQKGGNLWRVERKGDGWGEPFRLGVCYQTVMRWVGEKSGGPSRLRRHAPARPRGGRTRTR